MIPSAKDLQDISRMKEGSLREIPFAVLLQALSTQERTVVLGLRRNQLEKKILLEEGVPMDCHSNLLHETFGKFLVHRNKLTEEQYQQCLSESVRTSTVMTDVLLKHELISAFEMFRLLQQNLAYKLLDAFTWRDGQFHISTDVPPMESALKVRVPQLVFTGITRFAAQAAVDEDVGPLVGTPLTIHPHAVDMLAFIKLNPRHSRLALLLKQRLRIDQLGAESHLPFEELTRVLYALAVLGIVVPADLVPVQPEPAPLMFREPPPTVTDTIPPVIPPAPVDKPVPAPSVPPVEFERMRNEVSRAFLEHRKQDAFDLLGLPTSATPAAIKEKYVEFARKYAPWRFEDPQLLPLMEKAQDLFLAGAKAFALLSDSEQRNSLIYKKQNPVTAPTGNPSAYFAIKTELLDSEKQYKLGLARMAAGQYADAIKFLEFAADCDPQNGTYQAELAYCRFLLRPLSASQALKDLTETMRMDPECGLAVYYAGLVSKALGDRANAEKFLRQACKMMVGDRRPTEALKQLLTVPAR